MRVNVYSEELTDEISVVWVEPQPGKRFCGVRLFLKSHDDLHHTAKDDDRSAITFWLGDLDRASAFFSTFLYRIEQWKAADELQGS